MVAMIDGGGYERSSFGVSSSNGQEIGPCIRLARFVNVAFKCSTHYVCLGSDGD